MKQRYKVIPRTLCFVFFKDEVLLIKGGSKKEWEGTYNALGGHIEKGESVVKSAGREIKEETGLDVTETKLRGIVHAIDFFNKDVMIFVTSSKASTKNVVESGEGTLEWVKNNKIGELKIFEDVKPILKHLYEMKSDQIFVGTSKFDGKDKLLSLDININ